MEADVFQTNEKITMVKSICWYFTQTWGL